ncbi:hypothetical protein VO54_02010 [Elizabethkingia miricola]|nr:hypothetical protein VO54_02010 [Elizabethkingia miricola]
MQSITYRKIQSVSFYSVNRNLVNFKTPQNKQLMLTSYGVGYSCLWCTASDRNNTTTDQETCAGTITPQGSSAINVVFRWRTSGSGYTVNDNYLITSIQLK